MTSHAPKKAAIYARLSVTTEESVSISRQLDAGRRYAEARGWEVVGEFTDDGVSASSVKPENRVGWRQVLDHDGQLDAVIVWKVDRLARRVLDFLHADEALSERGAGIVAVEDPVDMTTHQGRAFATMLAVFGEMEAATISSRIRAARAALITSGRAVGGSVPYGWLTVKNPAGPGVVLAQDRERIAVVAEMAARVLRGETVYSVKRWLETSAAPLPRNSQGKRGTEAWAFSTVARLLRNPLLAGMVQYNPGRGRREPITDAWAVLRDSDGLPVVYDDLAVISTDDRRKLLSILDDDGRSPQARPRASKGTTSPLLSQLVTCGHCDRLMVRGTTQGRPSLKCPSCLQTVSNLDQQIEARLLNERGHLQLTRAREVTDDAAPELAAIESAIRDVTEAMGLDDVNVAVLADRLAGLKERRAKARLESGKVRRRWIIAGELVSDAWANASGDDLARRAILADQVQKIEVVRGRVGRGFDQARLSITWAPAGFSQDELASMA